MEYENRRVPARDRGLRNYFIMRKAELVAFFDHLGSNYFSAVWGKKASNKLCDISICGGE